MKTIYYFTIAAATVAVLTISACVPSDEFDIPTEEVQSIQLEGTEITIGALRDALIQEQTVNGNKTLLFDSNTYIVGYVISNDWAGNYFEELIIQDAPTDPTYGVKVLLDVSPLFITYEFGRKVYVNLNGLAVGMDSGVLALGIKSGNNIEKIAESGMFDFVVRDSITAEIVPLPMNISEFSSEKTNLYVQLEDVQFHRDEVLGDHPKTFAGEPEDEFDGERILESCTEGNNVVFSTSTFADFRSVLLPPDRGVLQGTLTYNFFGDTFNIVINDPTAINFGNPERCDPPELNCGVATTIGIEVLFKDAFEDQTIGDPISGNGWTNYIEAGTETWEAYFDDGTNTSLGISARMGSFGSQNKSSIGWLITPEIDFDQQTGETLNFKTSNSFADGSRLELLYSADWDGIQTNVTKATWDILSAAILVQDEDFFGDWIPSGNVDLSCISGKGSYCLEIY